jgi:hypothetical protein
VGKLLIGKPEECPYPVGGRGNFFDDLVELFDFPLNLLPGQAFFQNLLAKGIKGSITGIFLRSNGQQLIDQLKRIFPGFLRRGIPPGRVNFS